MKPRRIQTPLAGYLAASVSLHVAALAAAGHVGFGTIGPSGELSFAVTPRFEGEPVAWVTSRADHGFSAEPSVAATIAELELETPDWLAREVPAPEPVESDVRAPEPELGVAEQAVAPVELVEPDLFALGDLALASDEVPADSTPSAHAGGTNRGTPAGATETGSGATREGTGDDAAGNASVGASSAAPGAGSTPGARAEGAGDARVLEAPAPVYPRLSVRAGEEGTVRCRLHVAADGHVVAVDVVRTSGHPRLDRAAVEALLTWRFVPRGDGRGTPETVLHQVTFRLEDA